MAAPDFEDLITAIRNPATTPAAEEQKKVAAATIALRLIRNSSYSIAQLPDEFDTAQAGNITELAAKIRASITAL